MARQTITIGLTDRQAEALRELAAGEELTPEIYASEVLVKHIYHAYAGPARQRGPAADPKSQDAS